MQHDIILGTGSTVQTLRLLSMEGKVLWELNQSLEPGTYTMPAPSVSPGVYILQWLDAGGAVLAQCKVLRLP